jgi:N-acetylneuraminic acid mutarotase
MKRFLLQLPALIVSIFSGTAMAQAQATQGANLSLPDRVAYQYAIEDVYWRHRIWPKENASPKPPLEKVVSPAQVQKKVEKYLRDSRVLAEQSHRPITSGQLQGEMERMATDTKQPEVLRELFAALNNDPTIIAECLARPLLAERLLKELASRVDSGGEQSAEVEQGTYSEVSRGYTLPELEGSTCTNDSWTATSTTNAPTARTYHTAVWTGTEMIVWGGQDETVQFNTGGRYTPATDSWAATTVTSAPTARSSHTAVWTGTEMIVWSGYGNLYEQTGGRYNPSADSWVATTTTNAPVGRQYHTAVWTGSAMIVWGGVRYASSVENQDTGGRYDPATDSWVETSTTDTPSARNSHTAVWTGSEMLIWGGNSTGEFQNGVGRYNPTTNSWVAVTSPNAPEARQSHTAVWTGSEMIVWGGFGNDGPLHPMNTGGRFNPNTNNWVATTLTNAPEARQSDHTAIWTGSEMIMWGGAANYNDYRNTGSRYNPITDTWVAISTSNAPAARQGHRAVWTGTEMIVWGGSDSNGDMNSGGRYCAPPGTFANISTRLRVETGDNVLIGGFIVTGTQSKRVIVRAIGPSLPFPDSLADPFLELRDSSGTLIRANDNWRDEQEAEIMATTIPPSNDLESAIVATLPANAAAYTATVSGVNNGTGIGVVEVYDLDQAVNSKLANISTRGLVQTGDNVLIGGLIVLGQNPLRVILRAIGPSLPVPGALADPMLELRDGNGELVAANDNWRSDQEAEIMATTIAPTNDLESAIVRNLPPGNYTGIVSGVGNTTGVGLVEAYNLGN